MKLDNTTERSSKDDVLTNIKETDIKNTDGWTNFLEIRAYGLMRSGNHAIIEWIQNQHSTSRICFLNNVKHGDHDPYTNYTQKILVGIDEGTDTEALRKMTKRLLIYSYEDCAEFMSDHTDFLSGVFHTDFETNRKHYLGSSKASFEILIIRDPFNCVASRLKMLKVRGAMGGTRDLDLILRNWKGLAREAIAISNDPNPGKIVANYNRWATDKNYRKELSRVLKGTFNDSSMTRISHFGGGSSFDGPPKLTLGMVMKEWKKLFRLRRYAVLGHYWKRLSAPSAQEMNVFERWKALENDETFRSVMLDAEIIELSEQLFGEISGTREFMKDLQTFR